MMKEMTACNMVSERNIEEPMVGIVREISDILERSENRLRRFSEFVKPENCGEVKPDVPVICFVDQMKDIHGRALRIDALVDRVIELFIEQ